MEASRAVIKNLNTSCSLALESEGNAGTLAHLCFLFFPKLVRYIDRIFLICMGLLTFHMQLCVLPSVLANWVCFVCFAEGLNPRALNEHLFLTTETVLVFVGSALLAAKP